MQGASSALGSSSLSCSTADPTWELPGQSTAGSGHIWALRAHLSWAAVGRGKPSGWDGGREPVADEPRARFPSIVRNLACAELFEEGSAVLGGKEQLSPL